MKKFRVNVKRLSMTLGVLGTSVGLLVAAAWYQAPLAASQPPGDPVLLGEPSADERAALGEEARSTGGGNAPEGRDAREARSTGSGNAPEGRDAREAPAPLDPVQALGGVEAEELRDPKAGKHGPTDMALLGGTDLGDRRPATAHRQAAEPAVVDAPLEAGPRPLLVTLAAMDAPAPLAAPRQRSAVTWRPVGRIWRGENPTRIAAKPALRGAIAKVGEARYDGASRTLAIPVDGRLAARGLVIHRLNDGRAYVDLPGSRPTFSGSRSDDLTGAPISRWVMAAHAGPAGEPATRVAFRLEGGAVPRLELGGGEVRITPGLPVGGAKAAAPAAPRLAAAGTRLGEARYDVAAGILSIPVEGAVDAGALQLKRLTEGRLYLDVAGARPAFSGTRKAVYPGQPLQRWAMAGHVAGGHPLTRLAFTLEQPGDVDVRVADGEIRLTLPGHTGIRSAPLAPSVPGQPEPAETVPGGLTEEQAVEADVQ